MFTVFIAVLIWSGYEFYAPISASELMLHLYKTGKYAKAALSKTDATC